ncbi:MAG: hypothetical protein DCC58_04285 [Chloroflexi bacterium]|nr:MAG: hypothetical protein DCC58_04285 [Chloroflexota bacterium]
MRALTLLILLSTLLPARPAHANQAEALYFEETGFWVNPLFAAFWEANGGLTTFGYPISRFFYQDGLHKQYFERAIFERHEDKAGTEYELQLTRLGALITVERRKTELPFQARSREPALEATMRYFPETGHYLSGVFRTYWESHGGLQAFGYPLSDAFVEPDSTGGQPLVVQYFERARFEHHPEYTGSDSEVLLGHLGREALEARAAPPQALERQQNTPEDRDAPPLGPLPVGDPTPVHCGFNFAYWSDLANDASNEFYLDLAKEAGCEWIRVQFTWKDIEPEQGIDISTRLFPYYRVIKHANDRQLKVLVNVSHPPDWARPEDKRVPADPQAFGSFMNRLVAYFGGQVSAWQVWNEPNLAVETNGIIDPLGFFPLLKAAYPAIKASDPSALVVFPGLAPNSNYAPEWAMADTWYLESILAINNGEAAQYFDVFGVQAYGAGNHPDTYWPGNLAGNPGWTNAPEFYFRHAEELHVLLVNAGLGDKPVWITEMGWPTGNYHDTYGYGAWITPEMQAEYLTRAFEIMRTEWHWVDVSFIWHLNFADYGGAHGPYAGFSVIDEFRQPRPSYEAIRAMTDAWQASGP